MTLPSQVVDHYEVPALRFLGNMNPLKALMDFLTNATVLQRVASRLEIAQTLGRCSQCMPTLPPH